MTTIICAIKVPFSSAQFQVADLQAACAGGRKQSKCPSALPSFKWLICKLHVQVGESNPHSQEALLDQIAISTASRSVIGEK